MKTKLKTKKKIKQQKKTITALATTKAPVVELSKVPVGGDLSNIEKVLISNDLAELNPTDRFNYYLDVCRSLQLNPLTQPFGYISYEGRMTLYAKKDCAEQLRKLHGVSVTSCKRSFEKDQKMIFVDVTGQDKYGKVDSASAAIYLVDKYKKEIVGKDLANEYMKCETKAKRRLTLSICGLAMPDETEILTIKDAKILVEDEKETAVELEKEKKAPTSADKTVDVVSIPIPAVSVVPKVPETDAQKHARIVTSFPMPLQDLLKKTGFDTVQKAYTAYDKCAGDLDALEQMCREIVHREK